jgi:hypothetical protein
VHFRRPKNEPHHTVDQSQQMNRPPAPSRRFRIAYCALVIVLAGCATLVPQPQNPPADVIHDGVIETGSIEAAQRVLVDAESVRPDGAGTALKGIHEVPAQAEIDRRLLAAAADTLLNPPIDRGGRAQLIGTSYMVRLHCGGLVYVFEVGPQKRTLGSLVTVEHSVSPRIVEK